MTTILNILKEYKIETPSVEISNELKRVLKKNEIRLW